MRPFLYYSAFLLLVIVCFLDFCASKEICSNYEIRSASIQLDVSDIINQDILSSCFSNATELHMYSNDIKIRKISSDAFASFTDLRILRIKTYLSDMEGVIWSKNLRNVTNLSLTYCNLIHLPFSNFWSNMTQLESLNLAGNRLSYLPTNLMTYIPNLKVLDLSENSFVNFPYLPDAVGLNVLINSDQIVCSCTNVFLSNQPSFSAYNFSNHCILSPCKYFLSFESNTKVISRNISTASKFTLECTVHASTDVGFGIISPIGFIPGPYWDAMSSSDKVSFSYIVKPVLAPVTMLFEKKNATTAYFIVDYTRGHHAGKWQCVVKSGANIHTDSSSITIIVSCGVETIFNTTLIFGFCAMAAILLLGILIGSIRYLKETHCFRRQQLHKYVGRTLIGVIPIPEPNECANQTSTPFPDNIALDQRVCSHCLLQECFFCIHCQFIHAFTEFEIIPSVDADSLVLNVVQPAANRIRKTNSEKNYLAESGPAINHLLKHDQKEITDISAKHLILVRSDLLPPPQSTVINCSYEFPTEFCHCYHMETHLQMDENCQFDPPMRNVKLIIPNEKLANEYTEALQELEAAAKANDAITFRDQLEAFRSKLVQDLGMGVKVARDELSALRQKSAKSVAFIKDTSTAAAHKVRAGLKDSIRSVGELCGVGSSLTIGQSISVFSLYIDANDLTTKERCVSEFHF